MNYLTVDWQDGAFMPRHAPAFDWDPDQLILDHDESTGRTRFANGAEATKSTLDMPAEIQAAAGFIVTKKSVDVAPHDFCSKY